MDISIKPFSIKSCTATTFSINCLRKIIFVVVCCITVCVLGDDQKHFHYESMVGSQINLQCSSITEWDKGFRWYVKWSHQISNEASLVLGTCHYSDGWESVVQSELTSSNEECRKGLVNLTLNHPGNQTYTCKIYNQYYDLIQTFIFYIFVHAAPTECETRFLPKLLHQLGGVSVDVICSRNNVNNDRTKDATNAQILSLTKNSQIIAPNIIRQNKIIVRLHLNSTNVTDELSRYACTTDNYTSTCELDKSSQIYPVGITPLVNTVYEGNDASFTCFVGEGSGDHYGVHWNLSTPTREVNLSGDLIYVRNVSTEDDGLSIFCESSLKGKAASTEAILKVIPPPSSRQTTTSPYHTDLLNSVVPNTSPERTTNIPTLQKHTNKHITIYAVMVTLRVVSLVLIVVVVINGSSLYVRQKGSRRYLMSSRNQVHEGLESAQHNETHFRPLNRKPSVMSVVSLPLPPLPTYITNQSNRISKRVPDAFSKKQYHGKSTEHYTFSALFENASPPSTLQHSSQHERKAIEQNGQHHFHCYPQLSTGSAPSTSSQHHPASYESDPVGNGDANTIHCVDGEGGIKPLQKK